jgi:hypothetical protein
MMSIRDGDGVNKLPPRDPDRARTNIPISSLNDAWLHTLDSCAVNFPLSEVILPLTRDCFVAGAVYAVLLLQRGHGDQLARDIAGFINEASSSLRPKSSSSSNQNCGESGMPEPSSASAKRNSDEQAG